MLIEDIPSGSGRWVEPSAFLFVPLGDGSHYVLNPKAECSVNYSPENHIWIARCELFVQYGYVAHGDFQCGGTAPFNKFAYANQLTWCQDDSPHEDIVRRTEFAVGGKEHGGGPRDYWMSLLRLYLDDADRAGIVDKKRVRVILRERFFPEAEATTR